MNIKELASAAAKRFTKKKTIDPEKQAAVTKEHMATVKGIIAKPKSLKDLSDKELRDLNHHLFGRGLALSKGLPAAEKKVRQLINDEIVLRDGAKKADRATKAAEKRKTTPPAAKPKVVKDPETVRKGLDADLKELGKSPALVKQLTSAELKKYRKHLDAEIERVGGVKALTPAQRKGNSIITTELQVRKAVKK